MDELKNLLEQGITEELYHIIFSNPIEKENIIKIKIRPVMIKNKVMYQASKFTAAQVFHENYKKEELIEKALEWIGKEFKQMELEGRKLKGTVLVSKKGNMTVKQKKQQTRKEEAPVLSHNRAKKYILEGVTADFLIELGVQTKEGKIVKAKYDKWKQINRYLEFIEDILPILPKDRTVHIVDFGCGKSYLTFAMYYYLKKMKQLDVNITGLDLKKDVIEHCNRLSEKYCYEGLEFIQGDISGYEGKEKVDMVVTLHACDTATDYAIQKAVMWGAKVIFSVPCCQHEINRQIDCRQLKPLLKYGLLKERMAALITDGIRANLLEQMGYETQILEFIDMEHTPKNILIRAVKRKETKGEITEEMAELLEFLNAEPCLLGLLRDL